MNDKDKVIAEPDGCAKHYRCHRPHPGDKRYFPSNSSGSEWKCAGCGYHVTAERIITVTSVVRKVPWSASSATSTTTPTASKQLGRYHVYGRTSGTYLGTYEVETSAQARAAYAMNAGQNAVTEDLYVAKDGEYLPSREAVKTPPKNEPATAPTKKDLVAALLWAEMHPDHEHLCALANQVRTLLKEVRTLEEKLTAMSTLASFSRRDYN